MRIIRRAYAVLNRVFLFNVLMGLRNYNYNKPRKLGNELILWPNVCAWLDVVLQKFLHFEPLDMDLWFFDCIEKLVEEKFHLVIVYEKQYGHENLPGVVHEQADIS